MQSLRIQANRLLLHAVSSNSAWSSYNANFHFFSISAHVLCAYRVRVKCADTDLMYEKTFNYEFFTL